MVVNAIGAGWIIVIGRPLCAYRVQFFLCNHAHVVPIAILLLLLLLLAGAVHVVAGFSANGRRWNKLMHCIVAASAATYLHRQKAMSRLKSSCGPL